MYRKFGKRGRGSFGGNRQDRQGKKGYLSEEHMQHYRRISDSLKQFESSDPSEVDHSGLNTKSEFVNNVVSSLADDLVKVSQNQTVSSIVESIIAVASPANLRTLYVAAVTDLPVVFLDRFASHVFESLVQKLPLFFEFDRQKDSSAEPEDEEDDVPEEKVVESFETMCEFVEAQFDTLLTHVYGSHVLRGLLEALSGVPVAHELKKTQKSGYGRLVKGGPSQAKTQDLPKAFLTLFDSYAKKIFRVCDYEVHLKDPYFSLMLQAVLMILHKLDSDLCERHCQTIVERAVGACPQTDDPTESLPDVAQDTAGSRLLEVMFRLSSAELLSKMYESMFQGKLLHYSIHPVANYVLQKFMSSIQDKDLMEKLFEELSKNVEDVLAVGYFGLVTSLAESCRRLRVKQDEFITVLMEAFHCKEPEQRQKSLVRLIISFTAYEVYFSLEEGKDLLAEGTEPPTLTAPVNIHGSLLMQELLQFQKPKHAALGLLDLKPQELQMLCCDPSGSHIVDVFFSSPSILEKNRDIFLRKLKGLVLEIACSKNGSRCLESVWKNLKVEQRTALAKELAESDRLRNDRFGHFLFRNFHLSQFVSHRKNWLDQQGAQSRRKRAMREILHGAESSDKKKREEISDKAVNEKTEDTQDHVTPMPLKQKQQKEGKSPRSKGVQDSGISSEGLSPLEVGSAEDSNASHQKKKKKKKEKFKAAESLPTDLSTTEGESTEMQDGKTASRKRKKEKSKNVQSVLMELSALEGTDIKSEDCDGISKKKKKKKNPSKVGKTDEVDDVDSEKDEDIAKSSELSHKKQMTDVKGKKKKTKKKSRNRTE